MYQCFTCVAENYSFGLLNVDLERIPSQLQLNINRKIDGAKVTVRLEIKLSAVNAWHLLNLDFVLLEY